MRTRSESLNIGERTADRPRFCVRNRLACEHGGNSIFQIVSLSGTPRRSDFDIAVVDAPVILQRARAVEYRGLGRYGRVSAPDELVLHIPQRDTRKLICLHVLLNPGWRLSGIGVDHPELHLPVFELV